MIYVPVSLGELIDKITILKIKVLKMHDPSKHENVHKEYKLLSEIMKQQHIEEDHELFKALYDLNLEFWEYHDWQRERWALYPEESIIDITLYKRNRMEHILNDRRAALKKKINMLYKSEIVEEKQFKSYDI